MGYRHGSFVWLEHLSHDGAQVQRFYEALFVWRTDSIAIADNPPLPLIRSNGFCFGAYRYVPSAAPLMTPNDYGQAGAGAGLAGPAGAAFVIWAGTHGDRPYVARPPVGDWCWTELVTLDEQRSLDFFERIFGLRGEYRGSDGAGGRYHVLMQNDVPCAGLRRAAPPQSISFWLPYFRVTECEAATEQALALGARKVDRKSTR